MTAFDAAKQHAHHLPRQRCTAAADYQEKGTTND